MDPTRTGHHEYGSVLPWAGTPLCGRNKRAVTDFLLETYGASAPTAKDTLNDIALPSESEAEAFRAALTQPGSEQAWTQARYAGILFPGM